MSNKLTDNKIIRIIFVCHGNICRSPMAEYIMKEYVRKAGFSDSFSISSAAVSYEEQGNPIYPPAAAKLREKGIPYGRHSAHRITKAEAATADLILVMDSSNLRLIRNIIAPEDFSKVHLMMEFAGRPVRRWLTRGTAETSRGHIVIWTRRAEDCSENTRKLT